jgi:capsular polysaccharide biosynthesis protein
MTTYANRGETEAERYLVSELTGPAPVDRIGALWTAKWWIAGATVVAVLLTLLVSVFVPKVYSSDAQVSLDASPAVGTTAQDLASAANSLAAQYAQLVTSAPVLTPAAAATGIGMESLRSHTSAGTLASQNVIRVTVQAGSRRQAEREAGAVATALVSFVNTQGAAQAKSYSSAIAVQLGPLDQQITTAQAAVTSAVQQIGRAAAAASQPSVSAASALLNSAQSLLSTLVDRRAALAAQASLQSASLAPIAAVLGQPSSAGQVAPRPALYAGITGLLVLVLAAQTAIVATRRRHQHAAWARR